MAVTKTDRDQLIDCALALFQVKGYRHTTMADIGTACGPLEGGVSHDLPGKTRRLDRAIEEGERRLFTPAREGGLSRAGRDLAALPAARPTQLSQGTPRP